MNELDRALTMYRAAHPELQHGKETLTDILFFLVHKVEELGEQLKKTGRRKPRRTAKRSQEAIENAFKWAGMKGPKVEEPVPEEPGEVTKG
ncbi:MAG TPA: hypothetical protein PKZ83_17390 [bacterium]|nr:hypothetical protein [bacterium]HQJ66278.1 hypothetical protein [bacterium]